MSKKGSKKKEKKVAKARAAASDEAILAAAKREKAARKKKGKAGRHVAPLKIGVLISGSGTNLQAIIDAIDSGELNAQIVEVISSRAEAYGLVRAKAAGIPTCSLNPELYESEPSVANEVIATEFTKAGAEYIVMAGYMRKVTREILIPFEDRVLNLHPALLPSFVGAHAIRDAFEAGVKVTGITVHFANEDYDRGPIIAQKAVKIEEDDTLESLEKKIHAAEHKLYPKVLRKISEGRVSIDENHHVVID